jgi:hypothetical protein
MASNTLAIVDDETVIDHYIGILNSFKLEPHPRWMAAFSQLAYS